jgi:hypothetical protein
VTHVAREHGKFLSQVLAFTNPSLKNMHRERMPQIVHSGGRAVRVLLMNARPRADAHKIVSQGIAPQWLAVRRHENEICFSPSLCARLKIQIERITESPADWKHPPLISVWSAQTH